MKAAITMAKLAFEKVDSVETQATRLSETPMSHAKFELFGKRVKGEFNFEVIKNEENEITQATCMITDSLELGVELDGHRGKCVLKELLMGALGRSNLAGRNSPKNWD